MITAAGFVAGGGIAAAATMSGGSPAAAPPATSSADVTTLLNASSSTQHQAPGLRRIRRAGGIYGTITYRGKDGRDRTLSFERGTIVAVGQQQVVVRAPDGTTMTWRLTSSTIVREHRARTTAAALHASELVFVGGPVVSGAKDARLIVIRTTTGATS